MKKTFLPLLLISCINPVYSDETDQHLSNILAGKHRSIEHKHRDQFRHPQQTLEFFDVKYDMTVVEVLPGGEGWYTEILAPYLRDQGKLYAAHISTDNDQDAHDPALQAFKNKLQQQPKIYDQVQLEVLQPPKFVELAPEGSADRVLTFTNIHSWMKNDQASAAFTAMFKALKPGGILGVVEHRNSVLKPQDPQAGNGYVSEDYVIALARNVGFEFLAKSEINANAKDSKDYPEGVWTLPPTLSLKEQDKKKYLAIGESDRMTIKFIKPKATLTSLLTVLR